MKIKIPRSVLLLVPLAMLVAIGYLAALPSDFRGEFLSEYGHTLGRIVTGDWELSELTEPVRRSTARRRGSRHSSPDIIFEHLDRDQNGTLSADELGKRMVASLEKSPSEELAVSLDEFRKAMQSYWLRSNRHTSEVSSDEPDDETGNSASVIPASSLLDPTRVVQIEISMPADDWQALCRQSRSHQSAFQDPTAKPYSYFKGDIRIDGKLIRDVAIRKKGFLGSQDDFRPALKVRIDEYVDQQPIEGLDRLTLNNNKQDRALVSQYMTYELFRKAGIPAPRCSFAAVTVNGVYLGVYSNVEPVKEAFLEREFGNGEGNLYEGTLTDFYPKSIQWFEADTNKKNNDRSRILALATLLDNDRVTVAEISEHVAIDSFLRYWAVESLINFWDGYTQNQNNFFVYQNPKDGLMYFMPWGADSCFSERRPFRGGGDAASVRATGILPNRLYHNAEIPERYRSVMLDVLSEVWEEQHMCDEVDRVSRLLIDHIDFAQVQALVAMDDVRDFINGRREQVMSELGEGSWPVAVASEPRTPLYEDEVGSIQGKLTGLESGVDEEDELLTGVKREADVRLTLDERTAEFRNADVFGLDDLAQKTAVPLTIDFSTTYGDEEINLSIKTDSLEKLEMGTYKVTGELEAWSNAQQGREIRGEMTVSKVDLSARQLTADLSLKLYEKNGGHFARRR